MNEYKYNRMRNTIIKQRKAIMILSVIIFGLALCLLVLIVQNNKLSKAPSCEPKNVATIEEQQKEVKVYSENGIAAEDENKANEDITAQSETEKVSLGTYYVTGYVGGCAHCCGNENNITASGTPCVAGITCAAGSEFDFGTVLEIDGLGMFIVEDRGVGNGHIDIACATHEECYEITGEYEVFAGE